MQTSGATCVLTTELGMNPGLTLAPAVTLTTDRGTISSNGLQGGLDCVGMISGATVTGPGKFAVEGNYQGSCEQGTTSGVAPFEVPTSAGIARGTATYTVTWAGNVGQVTASGGDYGFGPGPFAFVPADEGEDCMGEPLTTISWQGVQIVIQS